MTGNPTRNRSIPVARRVAAWIALLALCLAPSCRRPPRAADRHRTREAAEAARAELRREAPPARAFRIESPGDLLTGPAAAGRIGDVRLDNGRAAFVVQAIGDGPFGFSAGGGNLIDAALLPDGRDALGQVWLYLADEYPRQAFYTDLAVGEGEDGEAIARARGHDVRNAEIEIETVYALAPDAVALRVTTSVWNRSGVPVERYGVGDAILWGATEPIGGTDCPADPRAAAWLAAAGRAGSFAYAAGIDAPFGCRAAPGWTDSILGTFDLPSHARAAARPGAVVTRFLAVGEPEETARAIEGVREARGDLLERAVFRTVGPDGEALPEARLRIDRAGGETLIARTDASGRAAIDLPRGTGIVAARTDGRSSVETAPFAAPTDSPVHVALGPAGRVEIDVLLFEVADAGGTRGPVRVTVRGEGGTPDPFFGDPFSAGGFGTSFVADDGRSVRPLAPGRYRVRVTRGPEYDLVDQRIDVTPGSAARVKGRLIRRVQTAGMLAADLHLHTIASTDAGVAVRDRVLACGGEGIEWIVVSDHNVVTDAAPAIEAIGLDGWIGATAGAEVTTDLSVRPVGHFNAFPLPAGGERLPVAWEDLPYAGIAASIRSVAGAILAVNHPRSPANGTSGLLGFDRVAGVGPYDPAPDLLEVCNGLGFAETEAARDDWAALVAAGSPVVPVGGSDSHRLDQFCGWPRTWVFVGRDTPAGLPDEVFAASLRAGRVVVSTGPFLSLRVQDAPPGSTVAASAGKVRVEIRAEAPPWIDIDRVVLHATGLEDRVFAPTGAATEAVRVAERATLEMPAGGFVWLEASGDDPLPVLPPDSPIRPWAMTGAVRVTP